MNNKDQLSNGMPKAFLMTNIEMTIVQKVMLRSLPPIVAYPLEILEECSTWSSKNLLVIISLDHQIEALCQ